MESYAITDIEAIGVVTSKVALATLRVDCPIGDFLDAGPT